MSLKSKREGGLNSHTNGMCPFHTMQDGQIKKLEGCVNTMKRDDAAFHATVKTTLKNISSQMSDGRDHFKTLETSIKKLEIAFAECKPKETSKN